MNSNNFVKYIFLAVVIILIFFTMFFIVKNRSQTDNYSLDQTSTQSNIKTDLRFAIAEFDTINPIISNNRNVQEITKIIYEPLVSLNENYKIEYCLAKEIAKSDDLSYLIKLRENVKWHDGSELSADDVIFTIEMIRRDDISSIYSENLKYVNEVLLIDESTVRINLSQKVPFFEYNLTFPIMSKKNYDGEDFVTTSKIPTGTGVFKIYEVGTNIIKLVQNEEYWNTERKPMATEININLYNTIGEVYAAFKNGEIDILSVKVSNIEDYVGSLGYNKIEYKARDYDFLTFNTSNIILSDPTVRKAISLVIDKNNIVASCLGKGYVASNFSLDMGSWLYTKDLNISVDTEQASQILLNTGWERAGNSWIKKIDGRSKKLAFSLAINSNNEQRVRVAENIKEQLANFGIPVTIKYLDVESYVDAINNREYEALITGIQLGYSPNLTTFFGEYNIANYYNSEVLDIMNEVSNTTDENVLHEKYNRLFDIYLEEAPYIGLYRNTNNVIYNQSLVGNIKANCYDLYHNIEIWYRQ